MLEGVKIGLKDIHKQQGTDLEYKKKNIRKRIDNIDKLIKSVFEISIEGQGEGLKHAIKQWESERKTLLLEEEQLLMATKQFYTESNLLLSFCNNAFETFQKGSPDEKRQIIKIVCIINPSY